MSTVDLIQRRFLLQLVFEIIILFRKFNGRIEPISVN